MRVLTRCLMHFFQALLHNSSLRQELEKLKGDPHIHALNRLSEVKEMPLHVLQSLQSKLKDDLHEIEKVSFHFVLSTYFGIYCVLVDKQFRKVHGLWD